MDAPSDTATGTPRDGKQVVQVQILGQELPIRRGEADPSYILELAEYVDGKMREVTQKGVTAASKVAIMASLNIADELFKERASKGRAGTDVLGRAAQITRRLDEILGEAG